MHKEYKNQSENYGSFSSVIDEDLGSKQQIEYPSLNAKTEKNYSDFETDDYSINSNFNEQTNYEIKSTVQTFQEHEQANQSQFKPLDIKKTEKLQEKEVSLTKTKQRFIVGGRMKIVLCSFVIIMVSLLFAIAWNFSSIARINSTLGEKESQIAQLQISITSLSEEYNLLDSEEYLKKLAEEAGFIEVTDENTKVITLGEMYTETTVTEVSSNWFNDVCDFFNKLFN